jgi:hypothetical protein
VRADGDGHARVVVEAAGVTLDALLHPSGPWAARGQPCRLCLRGAHVFGTNGARARAKPLVAMAADPA